MSAPSAEIIDLHRHADFPHRLLRYGAGPARALEHDLADDFRLRFIGRPALADWSEEVLQRRKQLLLHLDITNSALPVALLEFLDFRLIRIEDVVVGEDRIALDVPRVGGMNPGGIGEHRHY